MIIEVVRPNNAYALPEDTLEIEGRLKALVVDKHQIIIYLEEADDI